MINWLCRNSLPWDTMNFVYPLMSTSISRTGWAVDSTVV
jgi:hypothetical protein